MSNSSEIITLITLLSVLLGVISLVYKIWDSKPRVAINAKDFEFKQVSNSKTGDIDVTCKVRNHGGSGAIGNSLQIHLRSPEGELKNLTLYHKKNSRETTAQIEQRSFLEFENSSTQVIKSKSIPKSKITKVSYIDNEGNEKVLDNPKFLDRLNVRMHRYKKLK